ncbi:MAG: hypothetical protein JXO49_00715 [Deltaproteobacteria bacterium]|nr:hypothetical protein [Candidatus Anaeroferrophillus wilburensis]MBN2887847.1 hypothetical protein [Deltaproteobacteria bacterium]
MSEKHHRKKSQPDPPAAPACEVDTVHISIGTNGEINAWGLEQESEETILKRTGNQKLADRLLNMSYTLCG